MIGDFQVFQHVAFQRFSLRIFLRLQSRCSGPSRRGNVQCESSHDASRVLSSCHDTTCRVFSRLRAWAQARPRSSTWTAARHIATRSGPGPQARPVKVAAGRAGSRVHAAASFFGGDYYCPRAINLLFGWGDGRGVRSESCSSFKLLLDLMYFLPPRFFFPFGAHGMECLPFSVDLESAP